MNRGSKCKVGQAKTVLRRISALLKVDKDTMKKALSNIRIVESDAKITREPYTNEQLDVYASRVKWHPYLSSLMMFLLTCSGRAQDAYEINAQKLLDALESGDPYLLPRKKNDVVHLYIPDTESTPHILPFVQARVAAGAKYVWGSEK